MGFSVRVDKVGNLHRVRVGPLASRTDAIEALERIEAAGHEAMIINPVAN